MKFNRNFEIIPFCCTTDFSLCHGTECHLCVLLWSQLFMNFYSPFEQTDLLGQNILNYTHPDDHAYLKQQLIPKNLERLFDSQLEDENGEPRVRTDEEEKEIDRKLKDDKRFFQIRYV